MRRETNIDLRENFHNGAHNCRKKKFAKHRACYNECRIKIFNSRLLAASHHMESEANIKCQGNGCIATAAKHVVFGLRVFEAAGDIHISEMPYTPEHFDLCGRHIERVRYHYVHVSEYELGGCPAHPRDRSLAINASS